MLDTFSTDMKGSTGNSDRNVEPDQQGGLVVLALVRPVQGRFASIGSGLESIKPFPLIS